MSEERENTDQLSPVQATFIRRFYQISTSVRKTLIAVTMHQQVFYPSLIYKR